MIHRRLACPGPCRIRRARLGVLALAAAWILAAAPASALIYTYENTTSGAIPEVASDALCNGGTALERTFVVSDSFTVATIALGLNASHTSRGHLRAILNAPDGTSQVFIAQPGGGDSDNNYDILLSTNTEGALDDGDTDPVAAPFYNRIVTLAAANFFTGSSVGTWTLRVCDRTVGTAGTFNRAYLMLGSATAVTSTCTSRVSYDWGLLNGTGVNPTPLTGNAVTVGNITISQTSATDHAGTASGAFSMRNTTNGNHSGYYSLIMDASLLAGTQDNESVGLTSVIGFSVPVRDLSFQLLDVDITAGAWEDQIELIGTDVSGNNVPYTLAPVGGGNAQLAGDLAEGDASAATTATTGNLDVAFDGAVSSLTLTYTQGSDPANENAQMVIGLTDFNECAYDFGDAPATYGSAAQTLGSRTLYLGSIQPDGESATPPAPGTAANVDDTTIVPAGPDDEDGVGSFPASGVVAGGTYTHPSITVNNTTGAGTTLCGWIDFDINGQPGDGTFESDEGACTAVPSTSGGSNAACTGVGFVYTCSLTWTVPGDYVYNSGASTYARFRVSAGALTTSSFADGGSPNTDAGEVEDYTILSAGTLPVTLAHVATAPAGSAMEVRFATASESGNAGFRIWGTSARGEQVLLATLASLGSDSFAPQRYAVTVSAEGIRAISIEDVSLFGRNRLHGPFAVGARVGEEPVAATVDWAALKLEAGVASDLDRVVAAESGAAGGAAGAAVELVRAALPPDASAGGLLLLRHTGIHRVTHEELVAAGVDLAGIQAGRIAILDHGKGVPRHVEAPGGVFGPGAFIEFVAQPQLTLASPVDAYVLAVDSRKAVPVGATAAGVGSPGVTLATDAHRPDNLYSFSSPNGDPWLDAGALAWGGPASIHRTFDLPNLAAGPVTLKVRLWGWGDFDGAAPDHHAVVKVNGAVVAERRFDGLTVWEPAIDVAGLVGEAGNTLEISVPGDTGYAFDNLAFEGFEAAYSRATVARAERFQGTETRRRAFAIGGFAAGEPVSVWKLAGSSPSRTVQNPVGGAVSAAGGAGDVHAASRSALYHPGISPGIPAARLSSPAEYLIVTHPAFADSIADLVALEESRGFTTEVVTVDRIYAAYSDHAASPAALKSFFSASLAQGNLRYVLLVGADTTDPHDHLGLGSVSFVPTDFRSFVPAVTYSPTDESLVDRQGDGLGDVPIGRLPVRTPAELAATLAKLSAWEASIGAGVPSALLAAGRSDSAHTLAAVNQSYAASLAGWQTVLAQVDESNVVAARQQVLDAINAGAHLVSYVGHSSMGQWDFTPILTWQDVATLANAGLPNLFTAWGCWNSYYVEPNIESLAARLLRQPDAGAAGAIGATTLTSEASHRELGNLFFARVSAGAATVGEALHGAKADLQRQGGAADAIFGMTLLGDPAMSLPRR